MKVVGITGGIGSGKSLISQLLQTEGYPVYDSDARGRWLLAYDDGVHLQVKTQFGDAVFTNGVPDRKRLAETVFSDAGALNKLNNIIHPAVAKDFTSWCKAHRHQPMVFKESAILFESGAAQQTDAVISVEAPEALRLQRVIDRDGRPAEQIEAIMRRQLTDAQRREKSDYVIVNDETQPLLVQVLDVLNKLRRH